LGIASSPAPDNGKYEGEKAALVNCNSQGDDAASNFAEVVNLREGSSLSFANTIAGNTLDIRYCTMNNPGRLGLYVNGSLKQTVEFPSNGVWSGSYTTKTVSVSVPSGATIKLQYDSGGAGANIDYIQVR